MRETKWAKNERRGHSLGPLVVPAWLSEGVHHQLCPVAALRDYIRCVPAGSEDKLWLWPDSLRPCSPAHLATVICRVITAGDQGTSPKAHQVRSYAASLAYLRSFDLSKVQEAGQWASCVSFVTRYLATHLSDVPCVAMTVAPNVV